MPIILNKEAYLMTPVTITTQLASPSETLVSPSEELPTSEPSGYTFTYTVSSSDLATITSNVPIQLSYFNVGYTTSAIHNTSGASRTMYLKVFVNNTQIISTSTSLFTATYLTWNIFPYDLKLNDVVQVKLWASGASTFLVYRSFCTYPTRIIPTSMFGSACYVEFQTLPTYPILTLGNPSVLTISNVYIYTSSLNIATISSPTTYPALWTNPFTSYRVSYGDYILLNSHTPSTHASGYPHYYRSYIPTQLIYRFIGR